MAIHPSPKTKAAIVCDAPFPEATLFGSAESQIADYIKGARDDGFSHANAGSRARLSGSPCNHSPFEDDRAPPDDFDSS